MTTLLDTATANQSRQFKSRTMLDGAVKNGYCNLQTKQQVSSSSSSAASKGLRQNSNHCPLLKSKPVASCCYCCCPDCSATVGRQLSSGVKPAPNSANRHHYQQPSANPNKPSARMKSYQRRANNKPTRVAKQKSCCNLSAIQQQSRCSIIDENNDANECAKCQLMSKWTSAQALIQSSRKQQLIKEPLGHCDLIKNNNLTRMKNLRRPQQPPPEVPKKYQQIKIQQQKGTRKFEDDEAEISSLTSNDNEEDNELADSWSLSSCYDNQRDTSAGKSVLIAKNQQCSNGGFAAVRKRRLAPKPPQTICTSISHDSGNASSSNSSSESAPTIQDAKMKMSRPIETSKESKSNLLSETEVYSIEHFLKSHKSSVYVCGCMANLYLTNTQLINNGRLSRPTENGWQLKETGVPVLTFDSGLAKNRDKRRLCINLTERGSGFVLWSDIIDHLSNYRAFAVSSNDSMEKDKQQTTCDTFHVMYLSTNHRIMVGLSFDDSLCAKLFLKQIELVTSDPQNIALTGPKSLFVATKQLGKLKRAKASSPTGLVLRRPATTARAIAHQQDQTTWSTLKRAIKFGRCQHQKQQQKASALRELEAAQPGSERFVIEAFKPKPLASLAMAGKLFRNHKRMPRKCDISAPCLFEHVTKISQEELSKLYSRSLLSSAAIKLEGDCTGRATPTATSKSMMISSASASVTASVNYNQLTSAASISSSCYSSASISPTSSECGQVAGIARTGPKPAPVQLNPRGALRRLSDMPRPVPPKVPQRASSTTIRTIASGNQDESSHPSAARDKPANTPPSNAPSNSAGDKVQAIIKDLQAQTSSELVDAKRKLMADIADQVMALRLNERQPLNNRVSRNDHQVTALSRL